MFSDGCYSATRESENRRCPRIQRGGACAALSVGTLFAVLGVAVPAHAAGDPIKIGVIGEESAVAGASITKAAKLAADEINAHGVSTAG